MATKVTMVLKVDLQCPRCYKKIKKILCKYPQIRDQVYDEKKNTVTVTVVCCSPEKFRDKLCSKGGKVIESIGIKGVEGLPEPASDGGKPKKAPKAHDPEPAANPALQQLPAAILVTGIPPVLPRMTYYGYYGYGYPWYSGYGVPPPPQPSYDGCYGYGYPNQCGNRCSRGDTYCSEENPWACSIM